MTDPIASRDLTDEKNEKNIPSNQLASDPSIYRRAVLTATYFENPLECLKCLSWGGIWVQRLLSYTRAHHRLRYVRWQLINCDGCSSRPCSNRIWPDLAETELCKIEEPTLSSEAGTESGAEPKECGVCTDSLPIEEFPESITLACKHEGAVCYRCTHNWITAQLDDNVIGIRCPNSDCGAIMDPQDIQRVASGDAYYRFTQLSLRHWTSTNENFRDCLNAGCECGQEVFPGEEEYECHGCGAAFCLNHDPMVNHGQESCAAYDHRMQSLKRRAVDDDTEDEAAYVAALERIGAKPCPNTRCGAQIEKNGGCEHITCVKCEHEFCWICHATWSDEHVYDCPGPPPSRERIAADRALRRGHEARRHRLEIPIV